MYINRSIQVNYLFCTRNQLDNLAKGIINYNEILNQKENFSHSQNKEYIRNANIFKESHIKNSYVTKMTNKTINRSLFYEFCKKKT